MKKGILILTVIVMALTVVQPARAAEYWDLRIHNNTEDPIKIKLSGPDNYSFTIQPGKLTKTVEEGTYEYSFNACSEKVKGDITVDKDRVWLIIDPCPARIHYSKFVILNHMNTATTFEMSGPQAYELSVSSGKNKFLDIVTGEYTYTYDSCGYDVSGTIRVLKNGSTRLTVFSCERREIIDFFGLPNPSNLRIGSHYAFPINLTLMGPKHYYVQLEPGFNRLDVIRGIYSYFYFAFGKQFSGEFRVTGGGLRVNFSPLHPTP